MTAKEFCIHCGAEIPKGSTFCNFCGKKQTKETEIECPYCMDMIPKGSRFCNHCGEKITIHEDNGEICHVCGATVINGYCIHCGRRAQKLVQCPDCGKVYDLLHMEVDQKFCCGRNLEELYKRNLDKKRKQGLIEIADKISKRINDSSILWYQEKNGEYPAALFLNKLSRIDGLVEKYKERHGFWKRKQNGSGQIRLIEISFYKFKDLLQAYLQMPFSEILGPELMAKYEWTKEEDMSLEEIEAFEKEYIGVDFSNKDKSSNTKVNNVVEAKKVNPNFGKPIQSLNNVEDFDIN